MRRHFSIFLVLALLASGCGSGGSGGGGTIGGGGGPVTSPVIVNVTAGQLQQGVNVTVVNPATATPPGPPNAQLLGLDRGGTFSLFNTGDTISRSVVGSQTVALCGPGLSANMTVNIAGPSSDFVVSNISGSATLCHPTSGGGTNLPGIQFDVTVSPNATLGARTIILQNVSNNDITTFTGGLEVVP